MKNNFFRYVFMLFVVGIIIFAIYMIYFKKDLKENEVQNTIEEEKIEIKDLRFGISNFDTINPLLSNNKEVLNIDRLIYEPLMNIDKDYKLQKCLATECSKISDTSYVIKIDNNKKWQNGSPLIAKDIQFTIDRLKEGKSVYSYNVEKVISVEVLDKDTIKINLAEEVPFFEYNLTFPILPHDYYLGEDFNTSNKVPIGTGMFLIYSMDSTNIVLKKNENWWNIKNINSKIETITIKLSAQIGELYNSFKLGNIDIFTSSNKNLEDYIGTIGYQKNEIRGREFNYLAINCENENLSESNVRRAIAFGIDKANIVSSIYNNEYFVTDYPIDYGNYLYDVGLEKVNFSEEQAKKELLEAGWQYRNNSWQKKENYRTKKLSFSLTVDTNNSDRVKIAENIKEQLARIGIKITIRKVSASQYQNILKNKNYELILTGVYNSYSPNINSFFGNDNLQNYENEEINRILNEVKNINDENVLKEKYKTIQAIYYKEMPFIGISRNKVYLVKNRSLSGEINGNNYFSYYNIESWNRI